MILAIALAWLALALSIALVDYRDARRRTKLRAWPREALVTGQAAFGLVGGIIGSYFGPFGSMLGWAIGSAIGGLLFPQKSSAGQTGIANNLIQNSAYGLPKPRVWGVVGIAGNVRWAAKEQPHDTSSGGKSSGGPSQDTTSWTRSFAVLACDRTGQAPLKRFGRIWANGKPIVNADGTGKYASHFTYYLGSEDQLPDPTIQADKGSANVSAYRGDAYCLVKDLPLAPFGNAIPSLKMELIADGATLIYSGGFICKPATFGGGAGDDFPATATDIYGNVYPRGQDAEGLGGASITGTRNFQWFETDLHDLVLGLAPSLTNVWGTSFSIGCIVPIYNGQYLAVLTANWNFSVAGYLYIVICTPNPMGAPTPVGFVRINAGFGTRNFSERVDLAGAKTKDDPILVWNAGGPIIVCPSINEIINGTYAAGWGMGFAEYQVPYVRLDPIGSANLQHGLYSPLLGTIHQAQDFQGGWSLPNGAPPASPTLPSTDFYLYFNRVYMDYAPTESWGPSIPTEVATVLQPAYPHGCVVRVNLGVLDYASFAAAVGDQNDRSAPGYDVVNAAFVDELGAAQVPFTDEYTYISTGAAGGFDNYSMHPTLIQKNDDGTFLFMLTMKGISDESANQSNQRQYARVRGFLFNPLTLTFTQFGQQDGVLFTSAEAGFGTSGPVPDVWSVGWVNPSTGDLEIWNSTGSFGAIFLCKFGTVSLSGDVGLDKIVGDLLELSGLIDGTDFDVSALAAQRVVGFVLNQDTTAKSAIDTLQGAYFFDLVERDGKLVGQFRGGRAPDAVVPMGDLGAYTGDTPAPFMTAPRTKENDLQQLVGVRFIDQALNYQINSQPGKRRNLSMRSRSRGTIDIPVVFNGTDGPRLLVEKILYFMWIMRTQEKFTLPPAWLQVDVGDILQLTFGDDGAFTVACYVTKAQWGADYAVAIEGASIGASIFKPTTAIGSSPIFDPGTSVEIEPSTLFMLDAPLLRDGDDSFGYYLGARGTDTNWKASQEIKSPDNVAFDTTIATSTVPIVTGAAQTVLASAPNTVFDRVNTVRIQVDAGATLSSVTEAYVLNGKNIFLIGGELVGAATVTLVTPGVYDLSDLWRGIKGTDWASSTHVMGERAALIANDGSIQAIAAPLAEFNVTRYFKAVSFGTEVDAAASQAFTPQGVRIKPISPFVDPAKAARDGTNNLTVPFMPRSRFAVGALLTLPVDEPTPIFRADVIVGGNPVRTITQTASAGGSVISVDLINLVFAVYYSAADQTADGITPGNPVSLKVYQMSARIAALAGYPTSLVA